MHLTIFHIFLTALCIAYSDQQSQCNTPLGDRGVCVSLKYCPEILKIFTSLPTNRAKQYSRKAQSNCGRQITPDNYPVVCCAKVVVIENSRSMPQVGPNTPPPTTTTTTTTTTQAPTERNVVVDPATYHPCWGPDHLPGECKPLDRCQVIFNRLRQNPNDESVKSFLRESNKACQSMKTDVCCPSSAATAAHAPPPKNLPTENQGCGLVQNNLPKVVGGEDSQIGAWPWIALIGYNAWSLAPFKCGGTLVSARHVITAAHCVRTDLSFVRLGEFDLSIEAETPHVDINVNKSVMHPDYDQNGRGDIAVLYLVESVHFNDLISPICLPISSHLRSKSYTRSNPFVAGWGRTMEGGISSNVLQQLQVPVLENSVCENSYRLNKRLVSDRQFDNSVLCAGILAGGQDTCQGDSGGPLMIPEPYKGITRYYLIGVVSYGIGCARMGIPSVYSSTQYHMDWIVEMVADQ